MVHFKSKEKGFVMKVFQLAHIGNSLGIIFPKEILTTLGVQTGAPNMSLKHLTALNQNPIAPKLPPR
jgi:hypothetical protein